MTEGALDSCVIVVQHGGAVQYVKSSSENTSKLENAMRVPRCVALEFLNKFGIKNGVRRNGTTTFTIVRYVDVLPETFAKNKIDL